MEPDYCSRFSLQYRGGLLADHCSLDTQVVCLLTSNSLGTWMVCMLTTNLLRTKVVCLLTT